MAREEVTITTADGDCRSWVFTPEGGAGDGAAGDGPAGDGPWPGVIFYMDALAIRPALLDMGQRLADRGFVVLLPDLFHRLGGYGELDPAVVFASDNPRGVFGPLMASTDPKRAAEDTTAFLEYLDTRDDIAGSKVGATGYCMGGAMALTAAAVHADRVGAAASWHGGHLAGDREHSPHKIVDQITGRVYIGAADNDGSYPPEMAARLCGALMEASVDFRHDLYVGCAHGWTMSDFPIYDAAGAERHYDELERLFTDALT